MTNAVSKTCDGVSIGLRSCVQERLPRDRWCKACVYNAEVAAEANAVDLSDATIAKLATILAARERSELTVHLSDRSIAKLAEAIVLELAVMADTRAQPETPSAPTKPRPKRKARGDRKRR